MLRVSPETATVAPHQAAQLKSQARKSSPTGGFEALIDSNAPVEGHSNRSPRTAAEASEPQANDNPAPKTDHKSGHRTETQHSGKNQHSDKNKFQAKTASDNSNDARAIADDGAAQPDATSTDTPDAVNTDTADAASTDTADERSTDTPDETASVINVDATLDASAVLTGNSIPSDTPVDQVSAVVDASTIQPVAVAILTGTTLQDSPSAPVQDTSSASAITSTTRPLATAAAAVTAAAAENAAATVGETTSATKPAKDAITEPFEIDEADVTTATADISDIAIPAAPKAKASAASANTASANGNVTAETAQSSADTAPSNTTASNPIPTQQSSTDAADAKHGKPVIESAKTETSDPTPSAAHSAASPAGEQRTTPSAHAMLPDQGQQAASNANQSPPLFRVETTAAPQPYTQLTVSTSPPVPLSGLAVEIAQRSVNGKSSFEIRLDPAELGEINVRLDVKDGQVTSYLTVEKPSTLELLRRDAPQLQQALEDAGLKTGDSGLQFSLRDQSSSGHSHDDGRSDRNAQRLIIAEEDTPPAHIAGNYGRMLGTTRGVDIKI